MWIKCPTCVGILSNPRVTLYSFLNTNMSGKPTKSILLNLKHLRKIGKFV